MNRNVCSKHIFWRKYDGHQDIQDKYRDTSSNNVLECPAIAWCIALVTMTLLRNVIFIRPSPPSHQSQHSHHSRAVNDISRKLLLKELSH